MHASAGSVPAKSRRSRSGRPWRRRGAFEKCRICYEDTARAGQCAGPRCWEREGRRLPEVAGGALGTQASHAASLDYVTPGGSAPDSYQTHRGLFAVLCHPASRSVDEVTQSRWLPKKRWNANARDGVILARLVLLPNLVGRIIVRGVVLHFLVRLAHYRRCGSGHVLCRLVEALKANRDPAGGRVAPPRARSRRRKITVNRT